MDFNRARLFFKHVTTGEYKEEAVAGLRYMDVQYLCITGGSGSRRIWLPELPQWMADNPGTMIIGLRDIA